MQYTKPYSKCTSAYLKLIVPVADTHKKSKKSIVVKPSAFTFTGHNKRLLYVSTRYDLTAQKGIDKSWIKGSQEYTLSIISC